MKNKAELIEDILAEMCSDEIHRYAAMVGDTELKDYARRIRAALERKENFSKKLG